MTVTVAGTIIPLNYHTPEGLVECGVSEIRHLIIRGRHGRFAVQLCDGVNKRAFSFRDLIKDSKEYCRWVSATKLVLRSGDRRQIGEHYGMFGGRRRSLYLTCRAPAGISGHALHFQNYCYDGDDDVMFFKSWELYCENLQVPLFKFISPLIA